MSACNERENICAPNWLAGLQPRAAIQERRFARHDNGNVHRAAANIIVSKSRAARGSVCNVLLSRVFVLIQPGIIFCQRNVFPMLRPSEAIIHAVVTGKN